MTNPNSPTDDLLAKINEAVAAANEAHTELLSRSKAVGSLLLEAKKLHPAVKDFEAFLKRVDGLGLSRAYDLMRLAGGRTTDEELKEATRKRVKKHRDKKLPKPAPAPKADPKPDSVTVTESAEASAEKRKAENADLSKTAEEKAAKASADSLRYFKASCKTYLPHLNAADLKTARAFVTLDQWRSQTKKVA
jgi:hypothetical protein